MRIVEANFVVSGRGPKDGAGWPKEGLPELAFVGRSNVGKSSLLAALTNQRGLVRISKTPGRTRLINFFKVKLSDDKRQTEALFVDLPGYGYANVSKSERAEWQTFMQAYLGERKELRAVLLLVDARRELGEDEIELARWLKGRVAVIVVLTKADQLAKHARKPAAERAQRLLAEALGQKLPRPSLVSVQAGEGIEDLLRRIGAATNDSDKVTA